MGKLKSRITVAEMLTYRQRGFSLDQIGRIAGISGAAVHKNLARAERAFRAVREVQRAAVEPKPAYPDPVRRGRCGSCGVFIPRDRDSDGLCELCRRYKARQELQRQKDLRTAGLIKAEQEERLEDQKKAREESRQRWADTERVKPRTCRYCSKTFTTGTEESQLCDRCLLKRELGVLPDSPIDPLTDQLRRKGCSVLVN